LFKNEDINIAKLFQEYDPVLKRYSYVFNYQMDQRTTYSKDIPPSPDTANNINYEDKDKEVINNHPANLFSSSISLDL
jgi:hypothetical protein